MLLLDTNVVSELRKARSGKADLNVTRWATGVPPSLLFLSAITILELEIGTLLVQQRDRAQGILLQSWLENHVLTTFTGRILPVDTVVVRCRARLHVPKPRAERDALIAATALAHGMTVVTRNVSDFEPMGVGVFNPWQ